MKTILVVDDEYNVTHSLAAMLGFEGYATQIAYDGDQALQCLQESAPNLLVLDVMMPRKSGLDVLAALAGQKALAALPVILISGAQITVPAGHQGPVVFLSKPFAFDQLINEVRRLIG